MSKSIGELKEDVTKFTDLGAVFGQNLHESKEVMLRVDGRMFEVDHVEVRMLEGLFVLVISADPTEQGDHVQLVNPEV